MKKKVYLSEAIYTHSFKYCFTFIHKTIPKLSFEILTNFNYNHLDKFTLYIFDKNDPDIENDKPISVIDLKKVLQHIGIGSDTKKYLFLNQYEIVFSTVYEDFQSRPPLKWEYRQLISKSLLFNYNWNKRMVMTFSEVGKAYVEIFLLKKNRTMYTFDRNYTPLYQKIARSGREGFSKIYRNKFYDNLRKKDILADLIRKKFKDHFNKIDIEDFIRNYVYADQTTKELQMLNSRKEQEQNIRNMIAKYKAVYREFYGTIQNNDWDYGIN